MNLILWRHAEAEAGEPDEARCLTTKGKKQALKMGKWLGLHLPNKCTVLSSPAVRCVQTAQTLGRDFKTNAAFATNSSAEKIISTIGWPDNYHSTLIIGHQPLLGQVAALLIANQKQDWTIRKGAILWIAKKAKEDFEIYIHAAIDPDLI